MVTPAKQQMPHVPAGGNEANFHALAPSVFEIEQLVTEWRDARQAIFDTQTSQQVTPDQFARLADAEKTLMDFSRRYNKRGDRRT